MTKRFSIVKRTYLRIITAGVLFIGALLAFSANIRFSEEFTGGIKLSIAKTLDHSQLESDILTYLDKNEYQNSSVLIQEEDNITVVSVKTKVDSDEKVNLLSKEIEEELIAGSHISSSDDIISQTITGPSVGSYIQKTARNALIIGVILIVIYMLFSFSTIRTVIPPSTLAMVTVITMIFDVVIPLGAYGLLMAFNKSVTIDTVFIIAILTNIGYSINDTIVIFDRIRENIQRSNTKNLVYGKVFDDSLRQTMRRSVGTSLSALLVIIAMYIFGTGAIRDFSFTIGVGVIAGTFSSIFVAIPLAYLTMGKYKSEKKLMTQEK